MVQNRTMPGSVAHGVEFRDGMGRSFTASPDGVQRLHPTRAGGQGVVPGNGTPARDDLGSTRLTVEAQHRQHLLTRTGAQVGAGFYGQVVKGGCFWCAPLCNPPVASCRHRHRHRRPVAAVSYPWASPSRGTAGHFRPGARDGPDLDHGGGQVDHCFGRRPLDAEVRSVRGCPQLQETQPPAGDGVQPQHLSRAS